VPPRAPPLTHRRALAAATDRPSCREPRRA